METSELLVRFDQEQRLDVVYPGARREALEHVIRHISRTRNHGQILYSWLTADNADAVIAQQITDFAAMGHDLEWKLYAHDTPPDLQDRLAAQGFEIGEAEAVMLLDLHHLPAPLQQPVSASVRHITETYQISTLLDVQREVWNLDFTRLEGELKDELRDYPDRIGFYAVYADDKPVSSAWVRYMPDSQFASLWGGSTLAAYRGQGHYTALLAVRAQAALARGVRFLTVDASAMSRPILQKHGFEIIAWTRECNWRKRDGA